MAHEHHETAGLGHEIVHDGLGIHHGLMTKKEFWRKHIVLNSIHYYCDQAWINSVIQICLQNCRPCAESELKP